MNSSAPRLLRRYLWTWALLTLAIVWLALAAVAYYTGLDEADEILDGHLVSVAEPLLHPSARLLKAPPQSATPPARSTYATVYAPELRLVVWDDERVVWDTHGIAALLPASLAPGHHTLVLDPARPASTWRVFVTDTPADSTTARRVAVLTEMGWRQHLGTDLAEDIVRPSLVLLPLVALLMAWAIRRGLLPLERLSDQIAALDLDAGQTLPEQQPFRELTYTVDAINTLVQRQQLQLQRERRFTSDVAHELRTPLTAMLLQARRAREAGNAADRMQALQTIEQDALRAGHILGQLLDLARAQSLEALASESIDLCALAQRVLADHAPLAYERHQELALDAPSHPVQVQGHATMVELILRNLVDNALRHTPPGTLVEVRVAQSSQGTGTLTVSDNGARAGAQASTNPGMGVGLDLVQRMADAQGIALQHAPGTPTSAHQFTLSWPG
jgi:two-component system sensor histidine kinase QseC